jgi:flagellar biosynthesis/type III secretory pathway M-ring protein FliF/YscJ
MKENLKDILSNLNPDIDQETLLLYLQGKLTAEKQHELEKHLMDSDFEGDAIEGLAGLKDKRNLAILVDQLNFELKKKTAKRKNRREKMKLKPDHNLLIAVIIILLLIVISYFIIQQYLTQG